MINSSKELSNSVFPVFSQFLLHLSLYELPSILGIVMLFPFENLGIETYVLDWIEGGFKFCFSHIPA